MISEKKLHEILLRDIREGSLQDKIDKTILEDDSCDVDHSFFNRRVSKRYRSCVLTILSILNGDLDTVNMDADSIKSISMDHNKLFPDILAFSANTNDYLIFELKVDKQAERQTVTELLAYETELLNHLPLIERGFIHKIIVSTEFGSSLKHTVADLLIRGDSVLCLKPTIEKDEVSGYSIVNAYEWTVVNYNLPRDLSKGIFNGVGLCFKRAVSNEKPISEKEVIRDMSFAVDLLRDIESCSGGNGFNIIWKRNSSDNRIDEISTDYFVFTFAINPYLIYLRDIYDRTDSLSKYIVENVLNQDWLEDGAQEYKVAWEKVKNLFSNEYSIEWESPMNLYQNLMYFKESYIIGFNAWGEFGSELKETYWNSRLLRSSGLTFDDPDVFLKLLVYLYDEYPFKRADGLGEVFHLAMYIGAIEEICEMLIYDDEDLEDDENYKVYDDHEDYVDYKDCADYEGDQESEKCRDKAYENARLNEIRNLWKIVFCSIERIRPNLLKPSIIKVKRGTIPKIIGVISEFKDYLFQRNLNNKNLINLAAKYGSFSWELREYKLTQHLDLEMFESMDFLNDLDTSEYIAPKKLREVFDFCLLRIIEKCKEDEAVRTEAKELLWSFMVKYDKEKCNPEITEKDIMKIMKSGDIEIESGRITATDMIGHMRGLLNIYGSFSGGEVIPVSE